MVTTITEATITDAAVLAVTEPSDLAVAALQAALSSGSDGGATGGATAPDDGTVAVVQTVEESRFTMAADQSVLNDETALAALQADAEAAACPDPTVATCASSITVGQQRRLAPGASGVRMHASQATSTAGAAVQRPQRGLQASTLSMSMARTVLDAVANAATTALNDAVSASLTASSAITVTSAERTAMSATVHVTQQASVVADATTSTNATDVDTNPGLTGGDTMSSITSAIAGALGFDASAISASVGKRSMCSAVCNGQNGPLFEFSLPYVCPEPVLVKSAAFSIENGTQKTFS